MPKLKCGNEKCDLMVRIPPNRSKTSTGLCRGCYFSLMSVLKKGGENNG